MVRDPGGISRTCSQTFNLVPSMMVQMEEYAAGEARDPFLDLALKPAETLTEDEREFPAAAFLPCRSAAHDLPLSALWRALRRLRNAQKQPGAAQPVRRPGFSRSAGVVAAGLVRRGVSGATTPKCASWIERGRDFTLDDQRLMGAKQREIIGQGAARLSRAGRHRPDRNLHHAVLSSDPAAAVRFQYRRRVASQRAAAAALPLSGRCAHATGTGARIRAASISASRRWVCGPRKARCRTKCSRIAADSGFQWAATDNGVLDRTLQPRGRRGWPSTGPIAGARSGTSMRLIFRDHFLSDLIGFVYSGMDAAHAAADFLHRIRENCRRYSGRGPRCAGADHSGWRKRLGILRSQRPALPARALPAHLRRPQMTRRHRQRGACA